MRQIFKADRGSAITLTAILTEFKNNRTHTLNDLKKICREKHIGTSYQIHAIMDCLKEMGYVSNHGRYGNKHHFNVEFRTSHLMTELYKKGVIS
jgi:hypothetical protein